MPVSEKQKGYARKWDKENMRTISTRVRTEDAEAFREWCAMRGVSATSEIKRFVMSELEKYYKELEFLHTAEMPALDISSFDAELARYHASAETDKSKWIYIPCYYTNYRYILGTVGENPLITVGINPSTAVPENLDNTLESVERIANANGFDSYLMFNVYAQRSTDPKLLDTQLNEKLHRENMAALEWLLARTGDGALIWAAWGTNIRRRSYLPDCLSDIADICKKYNCHWKQTGKPSKDGHPHHPLYLKKDSQLYDFDVEKYLKALKK